MAPHRKSVRRNLICSFASTFGKWQQSLSILAGKRTAIYQRTYSGSGTARFPGKNNLPAFQYLNVEQMPLELLAGNFAQRALNIFSEYGDVYQTAGAYRTLAECYWQIKDYKSAGDCLNRALNQNRAIQQAPDLVASIRERLSLVYSAIDDKPESDYNRNIYLDLQEQSRQDRQLEARATQLDNNAVQLNTMIAAVIFMTSWLWSCSMYSTE